MYTINFWPVLVAAVVSFGIGALWYSPILFGKEWMTLTKMSDSDMEAAKAKGMWKSYVVHFIATLISFLVLAFISTTIGIANAGDGAYIAFLLWLGFVLPINVSEYLWKKAPIKLVIIDTVNVLVSLLIGGAIIGAWR